MNNIHDILESCLLELEQGADVESLLRKYPAHAEDLRPILEVSLGAKRMAVPAPSAEVLRRNRQKLMVRASEMREQRHVSDRRYSSFPTKWALAFVMLMLAVFSTLNVVKASAQTLPGDGLYPVKRWSEQIQLAFMFDKEDHHAFATRIENERLEEIDDLFVLGLSEKVDFAGVVTSQRGDAWRVANIMVILTGETALPDRPVQIGAVVRVYGITDGDGIVLAERIQLLPDDSGVPEVVPILESPTDTPKPDATESGPEIENETPEVASTPTASPVTTPKIESLEGMLTAINKNQWTLDTVQLDVSNAEIYGIPVVGALAKAEGYYAQNNVFVVVKINIFNVGINENDGQSNGNDNHNSNSNDNDNDNDNDDNNNNNNDDDNNNNGEPENNNNG
jgi:hypothetical protein